MRKHPSSIRLSACRIRRRDTGSSLSSLLRRRCPSSRRAFFLFVFFDFSHDSHPPSFTGGMRRREKASLSLPSDGYFSFLRKGRGKRMSRAGGRLKKKKDGKDAAVRFRKKKKKEKAVQRIADSVFEDTLSSLPPVHCRNFAHEGDSVERRHNLSRLRKNRSEAKFWRFTKAGAFAVFGEKRKKGAETNPSQPPI